MENPTIIEPQNPQPTEQVQTSQIITPPPSITQEPNRKFPLWPIIVVVVIGILLLTGCLLFVYINQSKRISSPIITKNDNKVKKIIAIQPSNGGIAFYNYDFVSKEKNIFLRTEKDAFINEANVSPDGKKLYYIATSNSFSEMPHEITIIDTQKTNKKVDFANGGLWTLSDPGILMGGGVKNCFWSPNSSKIACSLIERESPTGAGTGRTKISVFDLATGKVSDVLTSEQVSPPQSLRNFTKFAGWLGNNKLLVVQTKTSIQDIEPADFYSIDIDTKSLVKEFSYPYDGGFKIAITPNGKQIFFESFSRINEDKFVKYDLDSKLDTVLASTKDVLGTTDPVISEDGSKLVYTTSIFLKSVEEISQLRPDELKGTVQSQIHVYDLLTNEETKINLQDAVGFVEALLPDNKTFLVNKTVENSLVFDSETKVMDKIEGYFIGFGFF